MPAGKRASQLPPTLLAGVAEVAELAELAELAEFAEFAEFAERLPVSSTIVHALG